MSDYVKQHGEVIAREYLNSISTRYHTITKAVNLEFWNSASEVEHSLYVGSYGRGTSIDVSDIDMLVELPEQEYNRYTVMKGNGQSRLLQAVKNAILRAYPRSDIHADGQVVVVDFSDGMKFEVLPAFKKLWENSFSYPDTNMGGNWRSTNPKAEQEAMRQKNKTSNNLLFDTCKHIRRIKAEHFSSYKLSGIVVDSFVYHAMGSWGWTPQEEYINVGHWGDYERSLLSYYNNQSLYGCYAIQLYAPGSGQIVDTASSMECLGKVLTFMAKE